MNVFLAAVLLLGTLTAQCTAKLSFSPAFPSNLYETSENQPLMVYLTAPILTDTTFPSFNGSIEVEVITENLPSGDARRQAELGSDYTVTIQDTQSINFTVTFQSRQSESSQYTILINDDLILEGREYFRLHINQVRFFGEAASLYEAQDGVENTFVDVSIEDDDSVQVNWTTSRVISVTEGVGVMLRGEAIGVYAYPIAIGVQCSEAIVTGKEPANPGRDFSFTAGTKLMFEDVLTDQSYSSNQVVVPIIDDDIAEPRELFICTLQGDTVNSVQTVFPTQVTIEIFDNDELIVHWGKDFYEIKESDLLAEVELVIDSDIEVDQISIEGFPMQIPNPIRSLIEPGPAILGHATIELVQFKGTVYGNAQVKQAGRTDVQNLDYGFDFTPTIKSALKNFAIIDDDVLEMDELFIGEFMFGTELTDNWNVSKGTPPVFYCLIQDDDSVEVNFLEEGYTVDEFDGQVHVSLHIAGRFFIPVYATIEVSGETATDPEDYSGGRYYNVTFPQSAGFDGDTPASTTVSIPISIYIVDNDISEDVEYFQVQIVETNNARVTIGQHNTINVTIIDDDIKARAVSPEMTVVGRVTQTIEMECMAEVRLVDLSVTFIWKIGDNVKKTDNLTVTNGMATATYVISKLNLEEYDKQTLECHPSNAVGGHNFTQYHISVELFPPPNVTKFKFQSDRKDALDVEWDPVNVSGYPGASVEEYYIELAKDKDGSDIVAIATVAGDSVSHVFAVDECSSRYSVRIKAVNGKQNVSGFSDWMLVEAVGCPITGGGIVQVLPAWVIFLIVFLLLLFCLLCLILFCLLLLCCKRGRNSKGVYNAEKREKLYQADKASYRALQEECVTMVKMS